MNGSKNNSNQIELIDLALSADKEDAIKGGPDVNGDGRDDVITGAEANGHVKASPKLFLHCATGQH